MEYSAQVHFELLPSDGAPPDLRGGGVLLVVRETPGEGMVQHQTHWFVFSPFLSCKCPKQQTANSDLCSGRPILAMDCDI